MRQVIFGLKKFFSLSHNEFHAACLLMFIIITINICHYFIGFSKPSDADIALFSQQVASFEALQKLYADSVQEKNNNRYTQYNDTLKNQNKKQPKKLEYEIIKVELNSCDSTDVLGIPLFGSKRAGMLIEYRDKLGGFYKLEQMKEVFVLQDFDIDFIEKYFYINKTKIVKIPINTASYAEMVKHPYLDAYLCKQIIKYREKNGNIKDLEELKKATNAYQELIDKLSHYVLFE